MRFIKVPSFTLQNLALRGLHPNQNPSKNNYNRTGNPPKIPIKFKVISFFQLLFKPRTKNSFFKNRFNNKIGFFIFNTIQLNNNIIPPILININFFTFTNI